MLPDCDSDLGVKFSNLRRRAFLPNMLVSCVIGSRSPFTAPAKIAKKFQPSWSTSALLGKRRGGILRTAFINSMSSG